MYQPLPIIAATVFIIFTLRGVIFLREHGNEPYRNPGGLTGIILSADMWCVALTTLAVVIAGCLLIIAAPIYLLFGILKWPYLLSVILGLIIGLFIIAKICIALKME